MSGPPTAPLCWLPIAHAPIGPTVILGNENTGDVFPGYGFWGKAPFPLWCSLHPEQTGRCKPTHFQPMPAIEMAGVAA